MSGPTRRSTLKSVTAKLSCPSNSARNRSGASAKPSHDNETYYGLFESYLATLEKVTVRSCGGRLSRKTPA